MRVGRPLQPPTVKAVLKGTGTRWRVTATINGRQKQNFFRTEEEARAQASRWASPAETAFRVVYTRIHPTKIPEHEAAMNILESTGLSVLEAAQFTLKHYRPTVEITVEAAIAEYEAYKRQKGTSESQVSNIVKATKRFFRTHPVPFSQVTTDLFEKFMAAQKDIKKESTFNGLLRDCRTFFLWAQAPNRRYVALDPTATVEPRQHKDSIPVTLSPSQAEVFMHQVEKELPDWLPYASFCLFGAIRPAIRDGEAARLHEALTGKKTVLHEEGFDVDGKAHGIRLVPWAMCGPLRKWLDAYPLKPGQGLWPRSLSSEQATKEWAKVRARCQLDQDVLRHTGISAMSYAPGASLAGVALAVGNSESIIRKKYLGRWSEAKTTALWAILPNTAKAP